ncbi:hypothetical protein O181_025814 [Austropuccinia psidii MF-1]|uniref:Uncharacterized protein n=1 Tax=Austropuccinia psidii MF-1 TaxID=1389203 RepID=A0A9Q3H117_9BASI|nr:hypothetical protein [Austropuccinia psidii MF-1]
MKIPLLDKIPSPKESYTRGRRIDLQRYASERNLLNPTSKFKSKMVSRSKSLDFNGVLRDFERPEADGAKKKTKQMPTGSGNYSMKKGLIARTWEFFNVIFKWMRRVLNPKKKENITAKTDLAASKQSPGLGSSDPSKLRCAAFPQALKKDEYEATILQELDISQNSGEVSKMADLTFEVLYHNWPLQEVVDEIVKGSALLKFGKQILHNTLDTLLTAQLHKLQLKSGQFSERYPTYSSWYEIIKHDPQYPDFENRFYRPLMSHLNILINKLKSQRFVSSALGTASKNIEELTQKLQSKRILDAQGKKST